MFFVFLFRQAFSTLFLLSSLAETHGLSRLFRFLLTSPMSGQESRSRDLLTQLCPPTASTPRCLVRLRSTAMPLLTQTHRHQSLRHLHLEPRLRLLLRHRRTHLFIPMLHFGTSPTTVSPSRSRWSSRLPDHLRISFVASTRCPFFLPGGQLHINLLLLSPVPATAATSISPVGPSHQREGHRRLLTVHGHMVRLR